MTKQRGPGLVLAVLASGQFLMTLDSSVMNVSLVSVAKDLHTTITGIQAAITLYTLVMAALMITGGKLGSIFGRRRAFAIGLMIYGVGSLVTSLATSLPMLLVGWSLLEGIGAALIMPAIVGLVAANFEPERRTAAYGSIAAAGAVAIGAGPLIGGAVTTFASWRYVFAAETVIVIVILLFVRSFEDAPPAAARLDLVGAVLSVLSLGGIVFAVLRSGDWGWVNARPGAPTLFGTSPVIWLLFAGIALLYGLLRWETHVAASGREPLIPPDLLRNRQLTGGLTMFFFQFLIQSGLFFALPLFLTVVLQLNALQTGLRIFPLSLALLVAAAGIPRIWPRANPRLVVRIGLLSMFIAIVVLVAGMDPGATAGVVAIPMVFGGIGLGALASQLGGVTVSAVPDSRSADVGGLQNTATNLGASLGTALIGSVLIATLTNSAIKGLDTDPRVPPALVQEATTRLSSGVPWLSNTQLEAGLKKAAVDPTVAEAVVDVNSHARLVALRTAFAVSGVFTLAALLFTYRLPTAPPSKAPAEPEARGDPAQEGLEERRPVPELD